MVEDVKGMLILKTNLYNLNQLKPRGKMRAAKMDSSLLIFYYNIVYDII